MERNIPSFLAIARDRFNSLRTGRGMERFVKDLLGSEGLLKVSIPYEREGAWKGSHESISGTSNVYNMFQFPTNGKGHGKGDSPSPQNQGVKSFNSLRTGRGMERSSIERSERRNDCIHVSIPYEREGAWKEKSPQSIGRNNV